MFIKKEIGVHLCLAIIGLLMFVQIEAAAEGAVIFKTTRLKYPANHLALKNGILAVAQGNELFVYDSAIGKIKSRTFTHGIAALSFSSSSYGLLAVADDLGEIRLLDYHGRSKESVAHLLAKGVVSDIYMDDAHPDLCAIATRDAYVTLRDFRTNSCDLLKCHAGRPDHDDCDISMQVIMANDAVVALEMRGDERKWDLHTLERLAYEEVVDTCYETDPHIRDVRLHNRGGRLFLNSLRADGYSVAPSRSPVASFAAQSELLPCVTVQENGLQGQLMSADGTFYDVSRLPLSGKLLALACDGESIAVGGQDESGKHGVVYFLHQSMLFGSPSEGSSSDNSDPS